MAHLVRFVFFVELHRSQRLALDEPTLGPISPFVLALVSFDSWFVAFANLFANRSAHLDAFSSVRLRQRLFIYERPEAC